MKIKKGDRNDAVKIVQKAVGVTADGIFGAMTEKAVKNFQNKQGFTASGIVDDNTWRAMTDVMPGIVHKDLTVNLKARTKPILYLVLHYSGSSHSRSGRALATYSTFVSRAASTDFCVDDETIVQFNPTIELKHTLAVGGSNYRNKGGKLYGVCSNANQISIEICSTCRPSTSQAVNLSNHSGWSFTPKVIDNTVRLAKAIMKRYNIPLERVIRHYDVNGKLCPGIPGWNNEPLKDITGRIIGTNDSSEWEKFKKRLE